ncbi:MAG: 16S rRNA (cytidine(1402)-2'-O)-methyltransferase [Desulfosarcinaceae bacterium]|nr:16S rRNA (cytidine(1402)-2'-O)-methyltransferase [Desulfosarcinaceae bacterium]
MPSMPPVDAILPPPGAPPLPAGLYVVATPIGNRDDITLRALKTLAAVDLVAAEDTRETGRLLRHYGITARLLSYHEHNEAQRTPHLIQRLTNGERIALVSDAGTPSVSDPGFRLVQAAVAAGLQVVPVPGVSAAVSALSVAGLPTDRFLFVGFLPKKRSKRRQLLAELADQPHTLVFYESPRRIVDLLEEMAACFGSRTAMLAREMTKRHEEFLRGELAEIRAELAARPEVKGEITLLVSGGSKSPASDWAEVEAALRDALAAGRGSLSQITKTIAGTHHRPRAEVYARALRLKRKKG